MTPRSKRLVEYLSTLSKGTLPPQLLESATIALMDSVGCGLYGSRQRCGQIVNAFVLSEKSHGSATLYGCAFPVTPARAALANGTSTHGFEFDDTLYSQAHAGAVVVSSALAAAEQAQASGSQFLAGIVAGYEMMGRLVQALGIDHSIRGYHTTGVAGPVAATIAAGTVMGLDADQLLSAVGNACSAASGIKAFIQGTGGMTKRMHAGRAAESGVVACELARLGFTGPLEAIDGPFGLLQVIGTPGAHPELLDEALGAAFVINNTWVKLYPCCAGNFTALNALESLKHDHGFTAAQVKEIHIHTFRRGVVQNGGRNPKDSMAAQYSLPYCAAVAVAKNARDPAVFSEAQLQDPAIRELAARTVLSVDDELERIYPAQLGARVEVSLMNGQIVEATVLDPHGSPAHPVKPAEIEAKFRQLAASVKSPATIDRILAAVRALPVAPSLDALSSALREENI